MARLLDSLLDGLLFSFQPLSPATDNALFRWPSESHHHTIHPTSQPTLNNNNNNNNNKVTHPRQSYKDSSTSHERLVLPWLRNIPTVRLS
jgi:hypothetical protein